MQCEYKSPKCDRKAKCKIHYGDSGVIGYYCEEHAKKIQKTVRRVMEDI